MVCLRQNRHDRSDRVSPETCRDCSQPSCSSIMHELLMLYRSGRWGYFLWWRNQTKQWKREKLKKQICSEVSVNCPGNPWSQSRGRKGRQRWEGFAENEGFKPGMKEWGAMNDKSGESVEPMEEVLPYWHRRKLVKISGGARGTRIIGGRRSLWAPWRVQSTSL